ncbi:hypothetical protein [uncultured Exiguobacterium sp.]|uniref:hypothetical protein n=1 Tax=uncultured Exiguobacterium sp. TaxID=202669 RepID=UPI0025E8E653|nr:hypothetical protein [uncultured Exiguobacterium sp.]
MQHLQKEMIQPTSLPILNPVLCLLIDESITLHNETFVPKANQMTIILFIALRERTPLAMRQTNDAVISEELVYIEEVDFESRQLTLFHMNDSSLSHHRYVENDYLLSQQPQLLLSMS